MADFRIIIHDRTKPLEVRVDAIKKLSQQPGEYKELWDSLFPVIDSEDEDPVLRSAALTALSLRNSAASVQLLVKPFENPSVRRAAIEILDRLAPVTGEYEALLTAQLSALRGTLTEQEIEALPLDSQWKKILSATIYQLRAPNHDVNRSCMVINLSQRWGRDSRVLTFLIEELHKTDENRRRDAIFSLCMLGELKAALGAVNDTSPVVRSTLANRLGYYREAQGVEVLQRLLEDSDSAVSKEAKTALRLLNRLEMAQAVERLPRSSAWGQLLMEISRIRLADREIAAAMPDNKITVGWLGEPGATEAEIITVEQRIGVRLPPSYRTFLAETNGFDHISPFIYRLYGAAEIDWFRARNQDWIDAYQIGADISPEEHLANPDDCVRFRTTYLSSCLQISGEGDSAVVLLNPEVINDEDEWETWFFANWNPGAVRYSSFRAYVESELKSLKSLP
ncbi:MAG: HEAT repeat domain-containing protein [Terracidiphilus sp.]